MAISVNWATKIISVPKSYMTLLQASPEIRGLDLNQFRLDLKDLEDSEDGMPWPDTHRHNTTVTLGGITLARTFEIINGYTVTFEDGQYAVQATGANSNIADVMNVNQVSLRTFNSAGLIQVTSGSGLSAEEHDAVMQIPPLDDKVDVVDGIVDQLTLDLATVDGNVDTILSNLGFAIDDMALLVSYVKNKKALVKIGAVWHFRIYDVDGVTPIIDKELKDTTGADITDIAAGVQAIEGASSV